MSYFYHTTLTLTLNSQSLDTMIAYDTAQPYAEHGPAEIIMYDATGRCHGNGDYYGSCYDTLMAEGHVAVLNADARVAAEQQALSRP